MKLEGIDNKLDEELEKIDYRMVYGIITIIMIPTIITCYLLI